MLGFWRRTTAVEDVPAQGEPLVPVVGATIGVDPDRSAVDEAARIIQRHVEREARNRRVQYLAVRDLCPAQKAELVADLARLFR